MFLVKFLNKGLQFNYNTYTQTAKVIFITLICDQIEFLPSNHKLFTRKI